MSVKITFRVLIVTLFVTIFSCNKQNDQEPKIKFVAYKKAKKEEGVRYKKGIEHMADYQKEIRMPIGAKESTYKPGYLLEEFTKAQKRAKFKSKNAKKVNAVFQERGPINVPGRTRGIAVDPTNSNRWFVGTVGGGVWLTENQGSTWTNLTDGKIPNLATSTIAISAQDKNTIYVGTGEPFGNLDAIGGSGVFKTTDGGTTWTHLTSTASYGDVGRIIVSPSNKNIVLIGTKTGIYRTTDGGTTWTRTYVTTSWVQDLDADPTDFNIQYGSVRNVGVVKSTDGGLTWSLVFDRATFNSSHSRFELSVSSADSNYVYLSVYTPNNGATTAVNTDFYISKDKGTSFTVLNPVVAASSANLVTGQGWYDNVIMAHPYDKNIFYVGGVAVFKVTVAANNTFTFQSIASGYDNSQINTNVHVDQHGLQYVLGSNQQFRILLANDGGVYNTSFKLDPGTVQGDWSSSNVGKNSTQFYGASKQNGQDNYIAGAQDNGSWISFGNNADKNKSYQSISGGDGFEVLWHYNNPNDYISTIQYNRIVRYINNVGALSNFLDSGNSSISPFYTKVSNADNNPDVVFAVSSSGVWRSTDFGGNWNLTPINSNFTQGASSALNVEVSVANPNVVWAGAAMTESGSLVLHVSNDNGLTFTPAGTYNNPIGNHNYFISGIGTSPTNENRAYVLFSGQGVPKVLKTENKGQTWTDISGFETGTQTGFPDVAVHSILEMPFDENTIWAGTDIGLFETTDGGANWNIISDFISVSVYDMKIVNNQVVLATHGRGVWTATLTELNNYTLPAYFTSPGLTVKQKSFESLSSEISYTLPTNQATRVKIFVDGNEVTEITQSFNSNTTYKFDTTNLSEGLHTIGIQAFDDNLNLQTSIVEEEVLIIDFDAASQVLAINPFTASDVYIQDNTFKTIYDGFGNLPTALLNTADSPYFDDKTYTTYLRKPLTISANNSNFTYEDIAIIEPYDSPSTDLNSFYDFVTIEASKDLLNWVTLDKYDSRKFPDWLSAYNTTAILDESLFKQQSINLISKGFSNGETVVFRFKLVSDANVTAAGWYIKSVNAAVASVKDVLTNKVKYTLYPTINKGDFTIFGSQSLGYTSVIIYDINGKEVTKTKLNFSNSNTQKMSINVKPGVYFVKVGSGKNGQTTKMIIQ